MPWVWKYAAHWACSLNRQAEKLAEAGLFAYNHNLDTSAEYYDEIITTRTYEDRLNTLGHVRKAGISVCCGGIIGLGETHKDRINMLYTLANLPEHPESVPINALVRVKGTPLENNPKVDIWEMVTNDRNGPDTNAQIYGQIKCRQG